ncbi:MAG: 23S rRNA (adenine(2503)-C(2))-methyltransferase RlmN [Bdellovibrionaceae bacterium]|nr:23S rRNA (adenine(2503)-C(2))-methyltransferase RlmN [Pseudobdellovibrionaceae bacterium]
MQTETQSVVTPIVNSSSPRNFFSLTLADLEVLFKSFGKEKFRAQQVYKWVYDKKVTDAEQMTNLSKDFRAELGNMLTFELPAIKTHLKSKDGTQKFLFDVGDGKTVEAVVIPAEDRMTLCVSSEVGCNMACKFCFTGKQKLQKRLSSDQIVGQFLQVQNTLTGDQRLTNIVFMGMGEPLDNSDEVFKAVEILNSQWGVNFSRRRVTVSTSGIVPEMWKIAHHKTRLAVSLNGYDDESRSQIMPINKKYPLKDLLKACEENYKESGDMVTFEYVLLKGITDQVEHAQKLYQLTKHIPCKINIIPFNEHPGSGFERPSDSQILKFQNELMRLGVHVLLRRTMGRDIFAACGQLRSEFESHPKQMDTSNSKLTRTLHLRSNSENNTHT